MNYKKTLALTEKGPTNPEIKLGIGLLRWGIILASLGFALSLGLYFIGFNYPTKYLLHLGPWMLGGFVPLFLGLGLVLHHFLTEKE